MRRLVSTICFLVGLTALLLVPATAYASTPIEVDGTYVFTSRVVVDVRQAGGNTIVKDVVGLDVTLGVTGSATFERMVIIHADGEYEVHGIITYDTATVLGRSGTLTERFDGTGVMGGAVQGRWVILSGTGGLANMQGQGTLEGAANVAGVYSGQVHFDPD